MRKHLIVAGIVLFLAGACAQPDGDPSANTTPAPVATPDENAEQQPPLVRAEEWLDVQAAVSMRASPDRDLWFIVDRAGRILRYDGDETETILDITDEVSTQAEEGLLDMVIAPDGEHIYLHFTGREQPYGDVHIREYGWTGSDVEGEGREVLVVEHPYPHHNAGQIQFGPDGYLYISVGDGGTKELSQEENNGDPHDYGKTTDELLGNILRIDPRPSASRDYTIPEDNPFVGRDGRDEIWAYGLRNPWRFSFDRETGDLWLPDVGHRFWEEINVEPAGSTGGRNYGWSWMEGPIPYKGDPPDDLTPPLFAYPHRGGPCAIIGGYVYRGQAIAELVGKYVYGDFCTGQLWALEVDDGKVVSHRELGVEVPQLVSLAEDADGELFALSFSEGIFRVEPA